MQLRAACSLMHTLIHKCVQVMCAQVGGAARLGAGLCSWRWRVLPSCRRRHARAELQRV